VLIERGLLTEAQLLPLLAQQEQERASARQARIDAGEDPDASAPVVADDDFVIFDAGGESDVPLQMDTFAAVPAASPDGDLLFKSYLDE
jgi:hypothetical protein